LIKINNLINWLIKNNFQNEAFILKESSAVGLRSLGLGPTSSALFNNEIGDKWDFPIMKWFISHYTYNGSEVALQKINDGYKKHNSFSNNDVISKIKLIDLISEARNSSEISRDNYRIILDYFKINTYSANSVAEEIELVKNFFDDKVLSNSKDIALSIFEELFSKDFKNFISSDFISDVINDKWVTPSQAKRMSYEEALEKWLNKKASQYETILMFDDGWRWINAGFGKSEFVKLKAKNCGNSMWGNMRASEESAKKARMLLLLSPDGDAHAIATWNPEFKSIYSNSDETYRYLGEIEGVGSQVLKPKYYNYVKKLSEHLNIDVFNIANKSTSDGECTISNDDMKKFLGEDKSKRYLEIS
jgi:hypothetical protein